MATKQSSYFKGNARKEVATPHQAGIDAVIMHTHVFTEDVAGTDVLDLFPLIPYGKILSVDIASENLGAITLGVGFLTGTPGDKVAVRTCGTELFAAWAVATPASMTLIALSALAKNGDSAKSIGIVPSATITAGATKKLHMRITYALG